MGGAAGINLLLGMVRVKFAAVLIGASGVGLNTSFGAMQGLIGTIAGMGIQSSAVRDIAAAVSKQDEQAIGRAVLSLRRLCWLTGLVGMTAMMLLSPVLSQLTFGSDQYTHDIAALGIIILFGNICGGQMALIQGMRRIGDMARVNIVGAVFGTISAIGFYTTLGLRGIIPSLIAVSAFQLALSWYFARQVPVPNVVLSIRQTFAEANGMIRLGLVFMANGLMGSTVAYITVALITQYEGTQAVGLYSAALALSGMFINFVLGAMGADYYPRLTAAATDKAAMNRMVNEQTEIGLLLAMPGLLATMTLAPWIIQIFYSKEFLPAVGVLQLFILGCIGRIISWPLGYIMISLKKNSLYLFSEFTWNILHITLIFLGLLFFDIQGVSFALPLLYIIVTIQSKIIARKLIGFKWNTSSIRLIFSYLFILLSLLLYCRSADVFSSTVVGSIISIGSTIHSLRSIINRIGKENKYIKKLYKIRIFNFILPVA